MSFWEPLAYFAIAAFIWAVGFNLGFFYCAWRTRKDAGRFADMRRREGRTGYSHGTY